MTNKNDFLFEKLRQSLESLEAIVRCKDCETCKMIAEATISMIKEGDIFIDYTTEVDEDRKIIDVIRKSLQ